MDDRPDADVGFTPDTGSVPGLTYAEVGASAAALPPGYHHGAHRCVVGHGRGQFDRAAAALTNWQVHRRAGLRVEPGTPSAATGVEVRMKLGIGRLAIGVPCRVVYVVAEPDRRGFAYGTLPGHPEIGEESFVLELGDDGAVTFEMLAFSRPGRWFTRFAGPLARLIQRLAMRRYAWACRRCAR